MNNFKQLILLSLVALVVSCGDKSGEADAPEALIRLVAQVETEPVASNEDAADDPAIWINQANPSQSRILGTNKQQGLLVYNLLGLELQRIDRGRLNNVDVRQNVALGDTQRDIAVATNRTHSSLDVFAIEENGYVRWLMEQPLNFSDPYGVCLYHDKTGNLFAFVNDKSGAYQQWQILAPKGPLKLELMREFATASQPEGCAADDASGILYVGEESTGVWQMSADPQVNTEMSLVADVRDGALTADVEGIDIYRKGNDTAYLVVSSQGSNRYVIYDLLDDNRLRGSIALVDHPNGRVDGTQETDGLAVTSVALGEEFPQGILVVQDGINTLPNANQNFKIVDWALIKERLKLR